MKPSTPRTLPRAPQPDTSKPRVKGYHDEYQPPAANAVISISSAAKEVRGAALLGQPHAYVRRSSLSVLARACRQWENQASRLLGRHPTVR